VSVDGKKNSNWTVRTCGFLDLFYIFFSHKQVLFAAARHHNGLLTLSADDPEEEISLPFDLLSSDMASSS
jgi:hypothetical protein